MLSDCDKSALQVFILTPAFKNSIVIFSPRLTVSFMTVKSFTRILYRNTSFSTESSIISVLSEESPPRQELNANVTKRMLNTIPNFFIDSNFQCKYKKRGFTTLDEPSIIINRLCLIFPQIVFEVENESFNSFCFIQLFNTELVRIYFTVVVHVCFTRNKATEITSLEQIIE